MRIVAICNFIYTRDIYDTLRVGMPVTRVCRVFNFNLQTERISAMYDDSFD